MTRTDRDHLRVLSICHYVLGGLCFLFGGFVLIYLAIGIALVVEPPPGQNGQEPPAFIGWLFIGFAAFGLVFYWGLAAALVLAGRCLEQRRWRTFCLIVAGGGCLFQPLGMVLGIFTIIVLLRPSVREAFEPVPEPLERNDDDFE